MTIKVIPDTVMSLAGANSDRGHAFATRARKIYNKPADVASIFGNKCAHNPLEPRFYQRPANHKPAPYLLQTACSALEEYYFKPHKFLKDLRKIKSQRREACVALLQVIINHLDLSCLNIGMDNPQGFRSLTIKSLASKAGLKLKRTKRALKDLHVAGYIRTERRYKEKKGKYVGLAALREVSLKLFYHLGIKHEKLMRQINKFTKATNKVFEVLNPFRKKKRFADSYVCRDKRIANNEAKKQLFEKIYKTQLLYPDKTSYQIVMMLQDDYKKVYTAQEFEKICKGLIK